ADACGTHGHGPELRRGRPRREVVCEPVRAAAPPAAPVKEVPPLAAPPAPELPHVGIKTTSSLLRIQAAVATTWEQAIENVTPAVTGGGWRDKHVHALLRAGCAICKAPQPAGLPQAIL